MEFGAGWTYSPAELSHGRIPPLPTEAEFKPLSDGKPLISIPRTRFLLGRESRLVWFRSPELPELSFQDPVLYSPLLNQSVRIFIRTEKGLREIYRFGFPEKGRSGYSGWPNHFVTLRELAGERLYALVFSETLTVAMASPAEALELGERRVFIQRIIGKDLIRICLGFLFCFAALFSMILFLRNRSQKLLGAFALFALPSGLYVVSNRTVELQHLFLDAPIFWMYLEHISLALLPIAFGAFMWQALPPSRLVRWITVALAVYAMVAALLTASGLPLYRSLYPFFYLTLLSSIGISGVIIAQALRKNREARIILLGLSVFMLFSIYDMLGALGLVYWPFQIVTWGFLGFQASLASILYLRYTETHRKLQMYSHSLEQQVSERTASLDRTLREVRMLKEKQDGDYYLISLLMHPLRPRDLEVGPVRVAMELRQKKSFEYRNRSASIGGDVCLARELTLQGKEYVAFVNGDAMGKSMQGAGGAVVLGTTFGSAVERTRLSASESNRRPETWLRDAFKEMNRVFLSFEGSMLTTMLLGLIEQESGKVHFINCEHPYVAHLSKGESVFLPQEMTTKLGLADSSAEPAINQCQMLPGDALCIGSDGKDDLLLKDVSGKEFRNSDETMFLQFVAENQGDPSRILKSILAAGEVTDDLSLLTVFYQPE